MNVDNSVSQKTESAYVPTHKFSSGLSAQWRNKMVSPLALYAEQGVKVFDTQLPASSHDYLYGEFVEPDFFQYIDKSLFAHKASTMEWNYEMRRKAQEILPFLYLGAYSCIKDRSFLEKNGITLLLGVRSKATASAKLLSGDKIASVMGIEADCIEAANNQELITAFPQAIRRINQHLLSGFKDGSSFLQHAVSTPSGEEVVTNKHNKVLVYCESGNERSACVVIAYLMTMLNLSMESALWTVQHRRFSTNIEDQMRTILSSFESILAAKRVVAGANQNTSHLFQVQSNDQNQISRKRSFDDRMQTEETADGAYDADMWDGEGMFSGRHQEAPFQDK